MGHGNRNRRMGMVFLMVVELSGRIIAGGVEAGNIQPRNGMGKFRGQQVSAWPVAKVGEEKGQGVFHLPQ